MALTAGDWVIIVAYFALNLALGFYFKRQAERGLSEFFVSGRSAPWWLAGTSMVATTFAPDTPLGLTGLVVRNGIAGYWWNWSFALGTMLTAVVFAQLWQRCGVLTDVEFTELRYAGKPAAFLRVFRSLYFALPVNCLIMGWVNLAMVKILMLVLDVDKAGAITVVAGLIGITSLTSTLAGLRGVLAADLVQCVLMMGMALALAVFAVQGVGGLDALTRQVIQADGGAARLHFLPEPDSPWLPMVTFLVYAGMNWWVSWKPSGAVDGSGYIAQRMLAARDERNSLLAVLWFNLSQYVLRPWPWILVALVSAVAFPGIEDPESGYILVMLHCLPPWLRGLMLAGFAAAFMSTISTHLNWGASYLVNDVYRRFIRPQASERRLVRASRMATLLLTALSVAVTYSMDSISGAWKLLVVLGAGTGTVVILRWFWWRVNAWSEIAAMTAAAAVSIYLQLGRGLDTSDPQDFASLMLITVPATVAVWLAVTFCTPPEPFERLLAFYRRVRPYPVLWGPVAAAAPEVAVGSLRRDLPNWAAGCGLIYGLLFGIGKVLLDWGLAGGLLLALAGLSAFHLWRHLLRPAHTGVSSL
jgi:SSS family solute:Na+ symporter